MAGLLTKTVIRSPVVRWILKVRIRKEDYNDVALIGEDFVHIKNVGEHGHLGHVATKTNFDSRIRAAAVFSSALSEKQDDIFMRIENHSHAYQSSELPPQYLVLALDSSELIFVFLKEDDQGRHHFIHHTCPLPRFDRTLFQLGEHLAVDPFSRALAVAANEREVVIYASKSRTDIAGALGQKDEKWTPLSAQRPLQVDGVIQQMSFLRPSVEDDGHIILLLIVADQRRIKAVWIDWYVDTELHQAQIHSGQTLAIGAPMPTLLIPLRNAAFFLFTGSSVVMWTNLLSGSAVGKSVPLQDTESICPGASSRKPGWANWCRPIRVRPHGVEHIYLVREDGTVLLLEASTDHVISCHAGDFACHVGSAFASLGGTKDPDILIAAGETSSGQIYSIGHWATPIRVPEMQRSETLRMQLVENLPNWASVTDIVTSKLHGKSPRTRDSIFVTSGRQPYGAVTEFRRGLEARLVAYFEMEGSRAVTDIWALPLSVGRVLILLATPSETRLLDVSASVDSVEELDGAALALDDGNQTLAAAATEQCKLIQVTRRSICVSPGLYPNFEDASKITCEDRTIIAAAINSNRSLVATAERSNDVPPRFHVASYVFGSEDQDDKGLSRIECKATQSLQEEPLCIRLLSHGDRALVLVATSAGEILVYDIQQDRTFRELCSKSIGIDTAGENMCDSMAILKEDGGDGISNTQYVLVCGLRDGWLYLAGFDISEDPLFAQDKFINFGRTVVKVTQPPDCLAFAYATSGMEACLLTTTDAGASPLQIQNIWISDKQRPELAQGSVTGFTHMPPAHMLSSPGLGDSLILLSGDELSVTTLNRDVGPVPRQIPVSGTPNRLIYAEQQRCLVCASLRYDVQYFPAALPHAKPEERRQIWPVIDFIPSRHSEPSFTHEMQPGDRVHALLEWSFKSDEDKTYSFILVAGSHTRSSGSIRGRVTFLQPMNKNWAVVGVKEGRRTSYDAPVYALALLDDVTYVACVGSNVIVSRFSINERKWVEICAPYRLSSPGVHITAEGLSIYISTSEDSFVVLSFESELVRPGTTSTPEEMDTNAPEQYRYYLIPSSSAPRADVLISHTKLGPSGYLVTTKYGKILGLECGPEHIAATSCSVEFEAQLPRSLTRIRSCNTIPPWKARLTHLQTAGLLGCATDGSLIGLRILDQDLLSRLSWLQRLCEWSKELSPHSYQNPPYTIGEQTYARNERAMPAGLSGDGEKRGELVMSTARSKLRNGHVDGDVLERLLEAGGEEVLRDILRSVAARKDAVGEWMRQHLESEMEAVPDVLGLLSVLLDGWL